MQSDRAVRRAVGLAVNSPQVRAQIARSYASVLVPSGTFANRPQPEATGRLYYATDTAALYLDTGVAWTNVTTSSLSVGGGSVVVGSTGNITITTPASGSVSLGPSSMLFGIFGATAVARSAALVQTYATADRTLSAYTANSQSSAYTGIDNLQVGTPYAQLTDLNALRVAYQNLKALTEDLAQFVNSLVDDMQGYGWES